MNPDTSKMTHDDDASNRRQFLKSAATAGTAAATMLASVPRVHADGSDQIRVGLIGCGGRGRGAALNAMDADPRVRLVALGDLFEESLSSARQQMRQQRPEQVTVTEDDCFSGFDNFQAVIEQSDVVLLTAPPHYRPDHIEAAVAAGKHIFCEKPVATDPVGVARVRQACQKADEKGLNVVSGLCWRYDQGVRETMDRIFAGQIGKVISSQANYLTGPVWIRPRRPDESEMHYQCRNWYYFNWLSGDHIVEQFIHSLDKAMWLHHDQPPVMAYGMGGRMLRSDLTQGDIYDSFAVVYEWADGTRTHAYTRQIRGCMNQTEDFVYGSEGKALLLKHSIDGADPWKFDGPKLSMYQQEHNELFEAVLGKRPRINNGGYMCDSTLMAILGREVCYSGQLITWEQAVSSPQDLRPESYDFDAPAPEVKVPKPGVYKFPVSV